MIIAFDVDDTLIVPSVAVGFGNDVPNYEIIAIFMWYWAQGHEMVIWSGSGLDWAKRWSEKLGLEGDRVHIWLKEKVYAEDGSVLVDIAYDDCKVDLAKVNIRVKRINNSVSRKIWNETKRNDNPAKPQMPIPPHHNNGKYPRNSCISHDFKDFRCTQCGGIQASYSEKYK